MNLVWQFHTNSGRTYDGNDRQRMVMCSASTVQFYCLKYELSYKFETESKFFKLGIHGGPAMERFQLFDEEYDVYDKIFYVDTDVVISPDAPNIFSEYPNAHLAGFNVFHEADKELLEHGWLKDAVDADKYKASYTHGCMMVLSREFRQWVRNNMNLMQINEDKGKQWPQDKQSIKWPVFDQSLISYWITMSPFSMTCIDSKFEHGPYMYHIGGQKSNALYYYYYGLYKAAYKRWMNFNPMTNIMIQLKCWGIKVKRLIKG